MAALGWLAAFLLLASALAAARRRRRALQSLDEAVSAMAAGDLAVRADAGLHGRYGRLAQRLNLLSGRTGETLLELGADRARLRAILDSMVEGVALLSPQGRVQDVNAALERLLGVPAAAARGRLMAEVFRQAPVQDLARAALETGREQSGEAVLFTPEERVFAATATPLRGDAGPAGAVLVLHDITRMRRLEELRREFVANVSHELRTPLASIRGFAETLRAGAVDDRDVRDDFLATIEEQSDRLTAVVDDLLELASLEGARRPLSREAVALEGSVRTVLAALRPLCEASEVTPRLGDLSRATVLADPGALERVLRNLVENAVKYNRRGGKVTVSARREGPRVVVSVADTGIGIPAADLPRVFERFYRVDKARSRERGGTGLGLSIVKHSVEAMGGRVWAEAVEGAGSAFHFELPAVE